MRVGVFDSSSSDSICTRARFGDLSRRLRQLLVGDAERDVIRNAAYEWQLTGGGSVRGVVMPAAGREDRRRGDAATLVESSQGKLEQNGDGERSRRHAGPGRCKYANNAKSAGDRSDATTYCARKCAQTRSDRRHPASNANQVRMEKQADNSRSSACFLMVRGLTKPPPSASRPPHRTRAFQYSLSGNRRRFQ